MCGVMRSDEVAIVQACYIPVWPHCTNDRWNKCQEDLNYSLETWRRPPGRPRTTWMKTIQQDLKSNNLSLNEAIDVAQNYPLWRLMSTFGTMHSWCCMTELMIILNHRCRIPTGLSLTCGV